MKQVTVTGPVLSIASGRVELKAAQAAPRMHNLKPVDVDKNGDGVFEVKGLIQFKHGETFGHDGTVGKDGVVYDPDAQQRPGETAEDAVARVKADLGPKIAQEMREELRQSMRPAVEAQLRAELEPKVRAEVAEEARAEERVRAGAVNPAPSMPPPFATAAHAPMGSPLGAPAPAPTANPAGDAHASRTASSPDRGKLDSVKSAANKK